MSTDTESREQADTTTADDRPMFMVVTLRSGVQIRTNVSKYTVSRNRLGDLVGLRWESTEAAGAVIEHLDMAEVAAVHTEWP